MTRGRAKRILRIRPRERASNAALAARGQYSLDDGVEGYVPVAKGVKLWYRVCGTGDETVVVPCTGNSGDFERLNVPDRRTLYYDVRNRGRSEPVDDPTRLGFSAEVADLEAIRQTFDIERFSALGSSYNAGVLATYAIQHPDRLTRMVLVASIPLRAGASPQPARVPAPHLVAHLDQLEAAGLRVDDPEQFCREWRKVYVPLLMGDPDAFERLGDPCGCKTEWPWNVARSLVFIFAQLAAYDWRPHLRDLHVSTLIMHGTRDHDPVELAHEWFDALPDARLKVMDGVGQFPWVENPNDFFTTVNRFLSGEPV